ncbi:MAG TPA: hypothetical protein VK190_03735 [Pseudoneobacillus sp.]|nr:hypothetical protein [Pseudoneobacillus sp.]
MDEQRLDRMEDMLTKLISMVGNLNKQQQMMQEDLQNVKSDLEVVKEDQYTMRSENEKHFSEILKKLTNFQSDRITFGGKFREMKEIWQN